MLSPVKIWRNQKKIAGLVGKTGTVVSWTIVRVPPAGFADQAPYPVALIKLDDGRRICAQVIDCDLNEIFFGQKVATVIRRVIQPNEEGVIPYGIKVKML